MSDFDRSKLKLDFPTKEAFDSYIEALREGYIQGTHPITPEEDIKGYEADPEAHIDFLTKVKEGNFTAADGSEWPRVPDELLWLTAENIFVGSVSFRLSLSEFLEQYGGHVGYGIRPKYQGQGFATLALEFTKARAREKGMERLFLTCNESNMASEKVILKCGGEHTGTIGEFCGFKGPTKQFWINLEA